MKFTSIAVAAIASLTSVVSAGNATVHNSCTFPVAYRLNGMGGMTAGPYTLAPNATYSEVYRGSGSAILLGRSSELTAPLTLDYSPNGNIVYYDLSNNSGNPFVKFTNELIPSVATCPKFVCGPNAQNCYSNGASIKVKTCAVTANLVVTLCA